MGEIPANKKGWKLLLKALVSGSLLAAIFSQIPLHGVMEALRTAAWDIVALSLVAIFAGHYVKSVQMYLITRHQQIALLPRQIFSINLITMFYGLFLPGILAGGAIRWYHFSRANKKPAQALAAIILNRLLETGMLLCLGLGFWLIDQKASETLSLQYLLLFVLASLVLYVLSFSRRAHKVILRYSDWRIVPELAGSKVRKVLSSLGSYEDMPLLGHAGILLLAICHQLLGLLSLYMLAQALQLDVSFAALGWIRSLVALAMFLPISIGGLGVREATFIALLVPYGITTEDALTLSLLVFARGLVFAIAGGIIEARRSLFGTKGYVN